MKKILVFTFLIIFSFSNAQSLDKKGRELKIHLFNYEKGRQYLSFHPEFAAYIAPSDKEYVYAIGLGISYGYFPIKNWSIEPKITYIHNFNKPQNDSRQAMLTLQNKYFFLPKWKRFAIYVGADVTMNVWNYTANRPTFLFYNDPVDNKNHTHYTGTITPNAGISLKIGKVFTLPIGIGYNINIEPKTGRSPYTPLNFNIAFNYNFGLLKKVQNEVKF